MTDAQNKPAIERGQTWIPTKRGSGWRHICEADEDSVIYKTRSGDLLRGPIREFQEWSRRFECLLAPKEGR